MVSNPDESLWLSRTDSNMHIIDIEMNESDENEYSKLASSMNRNIEPMNYVRNAFSKDQEPH